MSLYSISGVGCCGDAPGFIGGKKRRTARKAKRKARRAKRKARRTGVNCKGRKIKAVVLSPARNAYLALVRLNVKKLAVKLAKATSTPEGRAKVHGRWCKLGGSGAKLQSAIDKAFAKYKRKRGIIGFMDTEEMQSMGAVSTITLLTTAAPIIAALAPLIKQFAPGSKAAEVAETAQQVTEAVQAETAPAESEAGDEVGAISVNPWLIGAGALAAYFLLKKNK